METDQATCKKCDDISVILNSDLSNKMDLRTIRAHYITYRTNFYLFKNPLATRTKALKYARVAWRRKLNKYGIKHNG